MYHFFVEPSQIDVINKKATVTGSDFNHIKNVLRMKPGEELSLSNGVDNREYRCAVLAYGDDCVDCELRFIKEDNVELTSKIYLFQGLPKSDKMETVIQKAVELGVYEIIPVAMSRSIVKLDAKKAASRLALIGKDATSYEVVARLATSEALGTNTSFVTGFVRDTYGNVLSGVPVCLSNLDFVVSSKTQSNGYFEFETIPMGKYELMVGEGRVCKTESLIVESQTDHIDISVSLRSSRSFGVTIGGDVQIDESDNAYVYAYPLTNEYDTVVLARRVTSTSYEFRDLPVGLYMVGCDVNDQFGQLIVEVAEDNVAELDYLIHVERTCPCEGYVENYNGTDVITVYAFGETFAAETCVDPNGRFAFNNLPLGTYCFSRVP